MRQEWLVGTLCNKIGQTVFEVGREKRPKKRDSFLPTLYVPLYHVYSTESHLAIRSQTMLTGLISSNFIT